MDKKTTETPPYLAGVIGHPISHSKSPKLHNYWLSKYKINGFYIPFSITTDKLQTSINEIRINQNYELFQKLNNFQEIDFSGKWYYSLEQHYRFPYEVDSFGNCIEENNLFEGMHIVKSGSILKNIVIM